MFPNYPYATEILSSQEIYSDRSQLQPDSSLLNHRIWKGSGWSSGHGSSPAISALGLLAFLFFLNLIQNSIINNRWMMISGGNGNITARSIDQKNPRIPTSLENVEFEPIGKERQKRSTFGKLDARSTSVSNSTQPIALPVVLVHGKYKFHDTEYYPKKNISIKILKYFLKKETDNNLYKFKQKYLSSVLNPEV